MLDYYCEWGARIFFSLFSFLSSLRSRKTVGVIYFFYILIKREEKFSFFSLESSFLFGRADRNGISTISGIINTYIDGVLMLFFFHLPPFPPFSPSICALFFLPFPVLYYSNSGTFRIDFLGSWAGSPPPSPCYRGCGAAKISTRTSD